jgi:hypothetical protein
MVAGTKICCRFKLKQNGKEFFRWEDGTFVRKQVKDRKSKFRAGFLIFDYGGDEWAHSRSDLTKSEGGALVFEAEVEGGWYWGHCAAQLNDHGK